MTRTRFTLTAALVLATACSEPERAPRADELESSESSDSGEPTVELQLDDIRREVSGYQQKLVAMTDEHEFSETHAEAASVRVWASKDAKDTFLSIDPNDSSQRASFSEGTMFVKEHFNIEGTLIGINVMFKGPDGYNPNAGNWYWIATQGETVIHSGRPSHCIGCHSAAVNTDFVVGFGKSQ